VVVPDTAVVEQVQEVEEAGFPEFLVGKWVSDKGDWKLTITEDGKISEAMIPLGRVRIKPHETTEIEAKKGEPGIWQAGDCEFYYDDKSNLISVRVKMDRIYGEMFNSVIEGTVEYFMEGEVAEDKQAWYATSFVHLDIDVFKPDPNAPEGSEELIKTGRLNTDPNNLDDTAKELVFTRAQSEAGQE